MSSIGEARDGGLESTAGFAKLKCFILFIIFTFRIYPKVEKLQVQAVAEGDL